MSCRRSRILLPLLLCALAAAQTPSRTYKLLSIHITGLRRLSENQVISASGLKLGQLAGDQEFQQAAQKLGQTGLFTDLTYSYKYSAAGCDLELQAVENDKLLPIIFENFVWFSDEELRNQLQKRVPLFSGQVPGTGDLTEQVAEALGSILKEHQISGEVQYLAYAPENGPVQAYEYKVIFHPVVIRNMNFPGASPDEQPMLQAVAKPLSGTDYFRTNLQAQVHLNFLPVYQARGYLKAQFGDSQARVIEEGATTAVDVSFPVSRGVQYKLKDLEINGSNEFPGEQLRNLVRLKINEPANAVQLSNDLEQIKKLYATKGYLFAAIEPVPHMDDQAGTVSYQLDVKEGELYRMGDLNIDGLPQDNATRMTAQWQMKKGDPFDESYLRKFFDILYRDFDLKKSYQVSSKQAINQQDKTVSVSLHFVPKS